MALARRLRPTKEATRNHRMKAAKRNLLGAPVMGIVGATKYYGPVQALKGVNLTIRRGQVHAVVGENGAGKSTLIGIAAGVVCYWGTTGLKHALGYDDSLDVFGVHGVGGALGAFLTGVLAVAWVGGEGKSGLIDGNPHQVITQLYGIAVVAVYDAIASLILLKLVDLTIGLRVDTDIEREGLDIAINGEAVQ